MWFLFALACCTPILLSEQARGFQRQTTFVARPSQRFLSAAPPSKSAQYKKSDSEHLSFLSGILSEINEAIPKHWDRLYGRMTFIWALQKISLHPADLSDGNISRGERVLQYMLEARKDRIGLTPDRMSFNLVLKSLSHKPKSKRRKPSRSATTPGDIAYRILKDWKTLYDEGVVKEYADSISYNTVMSTLSRLGQIEQLQEVYTEQVNRHESSGDSSLKPDAYSFTALISAYARQGDTDRVQALFCEMQEDGVAPTVQTFNNVMSAYSRSKQPSNALMFLKWWQKHSDRDSQADPYFPIQPTTLASNIALNVIGPDTDAAAALFADMAGKRDKVSYLTYLGCVCRHLPGPEALEEAEDVMEEALNNPAISADADFIRSAISYISTIDDSSTPHLAESLVSVCVENGMALTTQVYESLIQCWSKSQNRRAGKRALQIIDEVASSKTLKPTKRMVASAIYALSYGGHESLAQAEHLYHRRMARYGLDPNEIIAVNLIRCYCQSYAPRKATKAREILRSLGDKAGIVACNFVLKTCEYTDVRNGNGSETEALQVACEVFTQIRESNDIEPNHYTFSHFIACIGNLMPESPARAEAIKLVFRRCCRDGCVSNDVLQRFKAILGAEFAGQELNGMTSKGLPPEWSCNVPKAKR